MSCNVMLRAVMALCVTLAILPSGLLAQQREATPAATPITDAASPCTPIFADYPPLEEVRDIQTRPWSLADTKFAIEGVVGFIFVHEEGEGQELGDEEDYRDTFRTNFPLTYDLPNGETDVIVVGYHDDPVGVYEGDAVVVGGQVVGTYTGETEAGNQDVWPFMVADYVREVGTLPGGSPDCDEATPVATPIVDPVGTVVSDEDAIAATPTDASGVEEPGVSTPSAAEDDSLVISGTGSIVTEEFALEAGRYEVTLNLESGCCITVLFYGPSGSEEMLFAQLFSGDGGTVVDIYQVTEPGMYFFNTQNTEADWTITFRER